MRAVRYFWCVLSASLVLSGEAGAVDPKAARYYEDALKRFESQDLAGAVIQLKNAIQQDKTMLAAQVLLGKALLQSGDPIGAEVAFDEALHLGVDRGQVVLFQGQTYLMLGKHDTLLERLVPAGYSDALRREVLLLRASAYGEKGNLVQAERTLVEAMAINPPSAKVRAAQGALALRQGRMTEAEKILGEALALRGDEPAAWELKASILHVKGDVQAALAAYAQVERLAPRNIDARVARTGLLIDQERLAEAAAEVVEILKVFPDDPRAAYLQALVAAKKGDVATSQESLKAVVNLLDPVPMAVLGANKQMLMLLSQAHFGLGNQEKAIACFVEYLRRYPGDLGASKVLASLYLQRGQSGKVLSLLEPLKIKGGQDPRLLSLLAAAYMAERQYPQASRLLEESLRLSGGAADIRGDLGLSLVGEGRSDVGLEQLQQAFAKDSGQSRVGVALASLLMRRGQPAKALEVAETLAKKQPGDVAALNLLGGIRGAVGDLPGSRQAYEKVLQLAPSHVAAILNLARIEGLSGSIEQAKGRLNGLLRISSRNHDAMIELAQLEERQGNQAEMVRWLEKARALPSGTVRAGLLLVDVYLRDKSFDKALAAAKDVTLKAGGNLAGLGALARVQTAMGDLPGARKTLADMTRLANFDSPAQLEIARLQRAAGNDQGAAYSLEKALGGTPGYLPALVLMAEIEIAQKDFAKAEGRIKAVAQQASGDAVGLRLQGDLAMARGQYPAAVNAYRTLLGKQGGEDTVLRLFRAYERSGDRGRGLKALEEWSRGHPKDLMTLRVLGDGYLTAGDLEGAKRSYERYLSINADDASVLNNLATALLKKGDKSALQVAEKAYRLADRDANVIDTLGWVLVSQGQLERGVGLLRDARLRDPENREVRYHLAHALAKIGRTQEAREELNYALASGESFEGIDAARGLQRQLKN